MTADIAIRVQNLSKCYHIYDTPRDRLKQFVVPALCRAIPPLGKLLPTPHAPHPTSQEPLPTLIDQLRGLIESARKQALRAVDSIQVRTCWEIGRHIVEFEQQGQDRAAYGARLIPKLAESLTAEFGRGFDASNLRYMRLFYLAFPIRDALRHELGWTHYRTLLRVDAEQARHWYMNEASDQNWSTRALDRQIGTLYYERLLASRDHGPVRQEAAAQIAPLQKTPREFVRNPALLEFLGLPETGRLLEADLEQALINKLQAFLLELGKGFAFVARQIRISTETKNFYIDLVFYNYLLKCFVLFDLKAGELTHQDIGQMDMYVRMVDDLKRAPDDNPTPQQESSFAPGKIPLWCAIRSCTRTSNSLPANTNWFCRPKTNSGQIWKRSNYGWQNKKKREEKMSSNQDNYSPLSPGERLGVRAATGNPAIRVPEIEFEIKEFAGGAMVTFAQKQPEAPRGGVTPPESAHLLQLIQTQPGLKTAERVAQNRGILPDMMNPQNSVKAHVLCSSTAIKRPLPLRERAGQRARRSRPT